MTLIATIFFYRKIEIALTNFIILSHTYKSIALYGKLSGFLKYYLVVDGTYMEWSVSISVDAIHVSSVEDQFV